MRLRVLGSNGTYPTPDRPASGYLVDHQDTIILVDAGPATFPVLQTLVDPVDLDAVVISHSHADHSVDLFPLFSRLRFGPGGRTGLPVIAPAGLARRVAGFIGAGPDHDLFRILDFRSAEAGRGVRIGSLELHFGWAAHSVPALVTRVAAAGRRLVYSGDTGPGGDLVAMAAGADLLLCEATSQGEAGPGDYPFHLSATQAGEAARDAGAARLLLTHIAPGSDPQVSVEEAAKVFEGEVGWASPGLEVTV